MVKNDADCMTKGPGIQVKDWREIVLFLDVGNNCMWVDSRGKHCHCFRHGREATQEEAMGWFWLWEELAVNEANMRMA